MRGGRRKFGGLWWRGPRKSGVWLGNILSSWWREVLGWGEMRGSKSLVGRGALYKMRVNGRPGRRKSMAQSWSREVTKPGGQRGR